MQRAIAHARRARTSLAVDDKGAFVGARSAETCGHDSHAVRGRFAVRCARAPCPCTVDGLDALVVADQAVNPRRARGAGATDDPVASCGRHVSKVARGCCLALDSAAAERAVLRQRARALARCTVRLCAVLLLALLATARRDRGHGEVLKAVDTAGGPSADAVDDRQSGLPRELHLEVQRRLVLLK